MKHLLILNLFLIYSIFVLQESREVENDQIYISCEPFIAQESVDIQFYSPEIHSECEHSVNKFDSLQNTPIASGLGAYTFGGGNPNILDLPWKIRMIVDGWVSPVTSLSPDFKEQEDTLVVDDFWHSLWDSWNYEGNEFNTVKVRRPGLADEALDSGKNVIVSISHTMTKEGDVATDAEKERWKSIMRGRRNQISNLDLKRTILLLQDEPLSAHHGFTLGEVEFMAHWAKEYYGDIPIGFSFTRGTVMRKALPQNIDFVMMPLYLFFYEDYPDVQVLSKEEFDSYFDEMINLIKTKVPKGTDIFVIGQGFYNPESAIERRRKWRIPPVEAPEWYAEAVQRNDVNGLFWWVYQINNSNVVGLEDMPEYFEEILKLN